MGFSELTIKRSIGKIKNWRLAPPVIPIVAPPVELTYSSGGDTNGLIYYLGTNALTTAFANPSNQSNLGVVVNGTGDGNLTGLTDRTGANWGRNAIGSWCAFDLKAGKSMSVTTYVIRNRSVTTDMPRNWVLEGTNTISTFDITGIDAATWTAIDTRTNDTSIISSLQYVAFTSNGSTSAYRYLRARNTGVSSSAQPWFVIGEIEFYGVFNT